MGVQVDPATVSALVCREEAARTRSKYEVVKAKILSVTLIFLFYFMGGQ